MKGKEKLTIENAEMLWLDSGSVVVNVINVDMFNVNIV